MMATKRRSMYQNVRYIIWSKKLAWILITVKYSLHQSSKPILNKNSYSLFTCSGHSPVRQATKRGAIHASERCLILVILVF